MNRPSEIFDKTPVGKRFSLYNDSSIIYEKTGPDIARIVHREKNFYIGLGKKQTVYKRNKASTS